MGRQVLITTDAQFKTDFVVSTVAAASFLVAADECLIWVGATYPDENVSVVGSLIQCLEIIRENSTETPTSGKQSYATVVAPGMKKDVTSEFNATAALPSELKVGIWYGETFQSNNGASITTKVKRGIEAWLEDVRSELEIRMVFLGASGQEYSVPLTLLAADGTVHTITETFLGADGTEYAL